MPGDKLFQEGVVTFYNEVEKIRNTLNEVLKPNGSQAAPARSCYDLFLCNPSFTEGWYPTRFNMLVIAVYTSNY